MQDKKYGKASYADAFAGKVVFVSGGSSGINLSIAQAFARAGAKVAVISRSAEKVAAAAKTMTDEGHEAFGIAADVRDYQAVEEALRLTASRFGDIDVVVAGAAGNFVAAALDMSANGFKTVVDIDLIGTFKGDAQEFITWAFQLFAQSSGKQHLLGQSVIEVKGDRASAETYFLFFLEKGRAPLPNEVHALAGRYVDTLERRDGEWKIAHRVVVVDWSTVWHSDERFWEVEKFVAGEFYPNDQIYKSLL